MTNPIPDGFHTLAPHIIVTDGVAAIEFYKQAFGAQEQGRMMAPDGKSLMHAQLKIGNSIIMLGGEFPPDCLSPKSRGGTSVFLHLYVEDADAAFDRAVKAGCTVRMPVSDMFWGDRYGQVQDPSGHFWSIATHKHDYTPEQIAANAKAFFETMPKTYGFAGRRRKPGRARFPNQFHFEMDDGGKWVVDEIKRACLRLEGTLMFYQPIIVFRRATT